MYPKNSIDASKRCIRKELKMHQFSQAVDSAENVAAAEHIGI